MRSISKLYHRVFNVAFQHFCPLCTEPCDDLLCSDCYAQLPFLTRACRQCALPLQTEESLCAECQLSDSAVDSSICAFEFMPDTGYLIRQFKQHQQRHYADYLGRCLAKQIQGLRNTDDYAVPDALCPVPIHWRTLFRRGFNQSLYLAQILSDALDIPIEPLFRKTTLTPAQKGLDRKAREKNLKRSFTYDSQQKPRNIALIDDVVTTGATTQTLAHIAKLNGVEEVSVWALARTPK